MNPAALTRFGPLTGPVLRAAGLLALGAIAVAISNRYLDQRQANLSRATGELTQTQALILRIQQEQSWVTEYGGRFSELVAKGIVGPERRLAWDEQLQATTAEIGLPGISYELKGRETLPNPFLENSGYQVFQSAMEFKSDLLHSMDLVTLLQRLAEANLALIMPEDCTIKRSRQPERISPEPSLEATCHIWWVTLAEAATPDGQGDGVE